MPIQELSNVWSGLRDLISQGTASYIDAKRYQDQLRAQREQTAMEGAKMILDLHERGDLDTNVANSLLTTLGKQNATVRKMSVSGPSSQGLAKEIALAKPTEQVLGVPSAATGLPTPMSLPKPGWATYSDEALRFARLPTRMERKKEFLDTKKTEQELAAGEVGIRQGKAQAQLAETRVADAPLEHLKLVQDTLNNLASGASARVVNMLGNPRMLLAFGKDPKTASKSLGDAAMEEIRKSVDLKQFGDPMEVEAYVRAQVEDSLFKKYVDVWHELNTERAAMQPRVGSNPMALDWDRQIDNARDMVTRLQAETSNLEAAASSYKMIPVNRRTAEQNEAINTYERLKTATNNMFVAITLYNTRSDANKNRADTILSESAALLQKLTGPVTDQAKAIVDRIEAQAKKKP